MDRCQAARSGGTVRTPDPRVDRSASSYPTPLLPASRLASKHHWLIIACDACDTVIDFDLTVKRCDPDAPIRVALNDVRCSRCNAHGRTQTGFRPSSAQLASVNARATAAKLTNINQLYASVLCRVWLARIEQLFFTKTHGFDPRRIDA
jgi:hypothetical protein